MKKFSRIMVASILCMTTLAGCGKASTSTPVRGESSNVALQEVEPVDISNGPSWQSDTAPIELEWFVAYESPHSFDPKNNTFDQYLTEETGIKIKWSTGNIEKLNMLIATDSLPDIVTYNVISAERLSMENAGLVLPLEPLIEKYAPDMQVVPAMKDWYRNAKDDNWYAYASFFYDVEDTESRGGYLTSHNMNFARRDIMDQLGIKEEDMHTKEGFIDALRKVKESNIEYNGNIVEPLVNMDVIYLAEQFGLDREDKEGNLLNPMRQPEYVEALLFYNQMYKEGLITDEAFTMDQQLLDQKISSGQVFAGISHSSLLKKGDLFFADNNALMGGIGFITGDSNKEPIITPSPTGGWTGTMISKNCKNPARAIQLFSFLSQENISLINAYGGVGAYDIVDGEAIMKEEAKAERDANPSAYTAKTKSPATDYFTDWVTVQRYTPQSIENDFELDTQHYQETYQAGRFYDDKIFTDVRPDAGSELAALQAQIDAYWQQQFPLIVMANTPEQAKALYEEGIKQADDLGMQDLDVFKNERFKKNKEKMNVEFAWPRNQ